MDYQFIGIAVLLAATIFLFFYQIRGLTIQWLGRLMVHMAVGIFFLYFLNLFGGFLHLHIPLNLITVPIAGFLGLPGVVALIVIKLFII